MLLQKLIQFLYTWEVRLGVTVSMLIQVILLLFGSQRKISKATGLKILLWCAYLCADAVAIFSLGLLVHSREELGKNEPSQNHHLQLLWVPFLILHLGGPDTITAFSLEDNNLWLRHLLNLVIQVGVALYAIIKSWNKHNPLTYLVIPIFVSGVVRYGERTWALKSASFEQILDYMAIRIGASGVQKPKAEVNFTNAHGFLFTLTFFFADELLTRGSFFAEQGAAILDMTCSDAFRLVEYELGLMYDLLYTKASMIYIRLGICLRCLYLVSSVATLIAFVIIHKHNKHNESTWPYPLPDVLITYFLMIGAVILEIYAAILAVLSDWTLIWLEKHQNNNSFAKFLSGKISTYRGALLSEKRWSRSVKQYTKHSSPTALKRIKDWFSYRSPFSPLVPERWQVKKFEFEVISEAGDDAIQLMKEEVFKVIEDWFRVSNRRRRLGNTTFSEFISQSALNELWKNMATDRSDKFGTILFSWYKATTRLLKEPGVNIEEPFGSGSHSHSQYDYHKARSKYLSRYLMYLASFRQNMLPPGNYKFIRQRRMPTNPFPDDGKTRERVLELADSLTDYFNEMSDGVPNTIPSGFNFNNIWEIISSVWVHMLVYAAARQNRWAEHAQQLRRGGEFLTHVAVLFVHASTG